MSLKQTACFSCRWLVFWVALFIVEGRDSSLLPLQENRDVKVEITKADDKHIDNTEHSVECGLRKLTKRSSSFDASRLRDQDSRETNCEIFSITTAAPPVPTARTTTKKPGKATARRIAAAPGRWYLALQHYYYPPIRQHAIYRALYPNNRGANGALYPNNRGANGYRTIWYDKFQRDDSSEEKRKKRDTLAILHRKRARST